MRCCSIELLIQYHTCPRRQMHSKNISDPKTEPWGTPYLFLINNETSLKKVTTNTKMSIMATKQTSTHNIMMNMISGLCTGGN